MLTPIVLVSIWLLLSPILTCLQRYGTLDDEAAVRFMMDMTLQERVRIHLGMRMGFAGLGAAVCLNAMGVLP